MPQLSLATWIDIVAVLMISVGVIGLGAILARTAAAGFRRRERLSEPAPQGAG